MTGLPAEHAWDVREHPDGTPFTEAEVAELQEDMRSLREFLDRYHATPPEQRRLMSPKFSTPMTLPGGGSSTETGDEQDEQDKGDEGD